MTQIPSHKLGQNVQLSAVDYDPFAGQEIQRVVPTTEPQREVWLASRLSREASLAYNESVTCRFRGPLNVDALRASIQDLLVRHDALRATISATGEELIFAAEAAIEIPLHRIAASDDADAAGRENWLNAAKRCAVENVFDLERGPLLRTEILQLGADDHALILTAHHIVFDGWSVGIMVQELANRYAAHHLERVSQPLPLLAPAMSYATYADLQRQSGLSEALHADQEYWLSQFAHIPPNLDLPTDRVRTAWRSFASARCDYVLDRELIAGVRSAGAKMGASFFVTLLGAFGGLLQRLTGESQLVVGVPTAGQSVEGFQSLIGHCVNLLPIKFDLSSDMVIGDVIAATRTAMLDGYEHQEYTFGTLLKKLAIERDASRLPLVSVMFNVDTAIETNVPGFEGLTLDFSINARAYENFEISINAVQVDNGLTLQCQYNTDLFDAETIQRWLSCYESLLRAMVGTAHTRLGEISLISATDIKTLSDWNNTAAQYPHDALVHTLFEKQALASPDKCAISWGVDKISYRVLDERANEISQALKIRGVGRGDLVGIHTLRGPDMVASVLAVLKAGAGYVPLDPKYPEDRLAFMVEDAQLKALLTDLPLPQAIVFPAEKCVFLNEKNANPSIELPSLNISKLNAKASSEDVAYVIYTSGSTGKPKGVRVPHRAVVNFLTSMAREPGIYKHDRIVAVTTLSFDIAVNELLLPLSVGAEIVLASSEVAADGSALSVLLQTSNATMMQATPSTWRLLLDCDWQGGRDFKALCGGEALTPDMAKQLLPRVGALWNMYGPTETTVWSTCRRIDSSDKSLSIGAPIANTSVWVLDRYRQRCPIGVPGEIWIGGDGVTLGYLNRAELTAERFIADPFSTLPNACLYQTGDRGRWRNDGQIEHLGRLDFQVKLRGYRIELGEIESALATHASVSHALVIVREDNPQDPRLVAYAIVKNSAPFDEQSLKNHVKQTLPDYMVPQHIVLLQSLPLLPNGKVNRHALPSPSTAPLSTRMHVAAANELERTVVVTMAKILALPDISVEDGFFALGGHSLLASQLASQLSKQVGIQVPMRAVFEASTARRLAHWIERSTGAGAKAAWSIPRRADRSRAPLSAMQQRMWFLEQLDPGKTFHNTPSAHRLRGQLDERAFQRAFAEMVRRQDILRTVIVTEDESTMQLILPELEYDLFPAHDLSALPTSQREPRLLQALDELIAQPFDLSEAPLFCARMFRLDDEEHVLFFMVHHIIWDGWSFDVLYEEIHALYDAYRLEKPSPLAELSVQYGDFAAWQRAWMRTDDARAEVEHWRGVLNGASEPLAVPTDYPRPATMSGNGKMVWMNVPGKLVNASRELGRSVDATAYMTLLAAYFVLLHQLTAQRNIVVGTPVRGRQVADLEPVMGFFVNAIPLRLQIPESTTFIAFLTAVRDAVRLGLEHPDVPLEELVRELNLPRDRSRSPVFQAMFSYQDARRRNSRWGNLERERLEVMQPGVTADLSLWTVELPDSLFLGLSYNTDILSDDTAALLRDRYADVLQQIIDDPELSIDKLALPANEQALVDSWNKTSAQANQSTPQDAFAHSHFIQLAAKSPALPAVRMGATRLSYGELDARSNQLAKVIVARGIGRGDLVGLFVHRSIDMLVALLGVLKSGAAYVPLDPAYPQERLALMVDDAGIALLLTEQSLKEQLPFAAEKTLLVDQAMQAVQSTAAPVLTSSPEAPAYVIYTSGSTGKPKGVAIPHRAVVNFLASMRDEPGLSAKDRLLAVTTLSFDIAVLELLLPLSVGAEVVIASREEATDAAALAALLAASEATVMQATPATWRMLIDAGWQAPQRFKALVGGEALAKDLAQQLLAMNIELWNMYGPTETTVWSTCWRVAHPERGISIGRPIANTQIYILTEARQLCPLGVAGEIWIGGAGVASGYLNRGELTAERFIPDPFSKMPGARLYRTGDRGRWRADGQLEHLGRLDYQVKIRGFRIELGEIEETLASQSIVSLAIVLAREDVPGDVRLVAYVVENEAAERNLNSGRNDGDIDTVTMLREHLRSCLPAYMIPQHFVLLKALPQLPNGKINRAALPLPLSTANQGANDSANKAQQSGHAPSTEMEKILAAVWCELLHTKQIYIDDNFFDLGGHSLLAMQAIQRMEKTTGKRVNPGRFVFETLAQIARGYDETKIEEIKKVSGARRFFSRLVGAKADSKND
jgi:amino acid adenylation domain-containing protein